MGFIFVLLHLIRNNTHHLFVGIPVIVLVLKYDYERLSESELFHKYASDIFVTIYLLYVAFCVHAFCQSLGRRT